MVLVPWLNLIGFTFPVAFAAYVSGYLATMSRTSAIGSVLPAVLALFGGLNVYVFNTETRFRFLVSYCVCVFVLMLFFGTQYGGYLRQNTREYRLRDLAVQERHIRILRHNLGLPADFPEWMIAPESK